MTGWDDVRRQARNCPVLRQVVDAVDAGMINRETALMAAAVLLSKARIELVEIMTERISLQPGPPILLKPFSYGDRVKSGDRVGVFEGLHPIHDGALVRFDGDGGQSLTRLSELQKAD